MLHRLIREDGASHREPKRLMYGASFPVRVNEKRNVRRFVLKMAESRLRKLAATNAYLSH